MYIKEGIEFQIPLSSVKQQDPAEQSEQIGQAGVQRVCDALVFYFNSTTKSRNTKHAGKQLRTTLLRIVAPLAGSSAEPHRIVNGTVLSPEPLVDPVPVEGDEVFYVFLQPSARGT